MRLKIAASVATLALALAVASPAAAQGISYVVKQTVGSGSVVGQIATDGTIGTLATANIKAWTLALNGAGATYNVSDANSSVVVQGNAVTATAMNLSFDYSSSGSNLLVFQNGLYSGNHYWCNANSLGACKQGASVVPNSAFDSAAIFEPRTGVQILGTSGAAPTISVTTVQALYASLYDLAVSQQAQMITADLFAKLLLGKNDQISCGDCGSTGVSFGSLSVSTHARKAITPEISALFGFAIGHYQEKGAYVSDSYTLAGGLRYDPAERGKSRPYLEVGGAIAPGQTAKYQRAYQTGTGIAVGSGTSKTGNYSVYARAGWVSRLSPRDELGGNVSVGHSWQTQTSYAEQTGSTNPFDAQYNGGNSQANIAGVSGQYTHLFGKRVEVAIDGTVSRSFGSSSGVAATIAGYGTNSVAASEFTYFEPGARFSLRVSRRFKIDGFVNATIASGGIGRSVHEGVAVSFQL